VSLLLILVYAYVDVGNVCLSDGKQSYLGLIHCAQVL
jgi:hypothetical protein